MIKLVFHLQFKEDYYLEEKVGFRTFTVNALFNFIYFVIRMFKLNPDFKPGGAWDGEGESNTLLFELKRNWQGLLIEPNKQNFVNLVKKHRKAMMLEVCLSVNNKYELVEFVNLVSHLNLA